MKDLIFNPITKIYQRQDKEGKWIDVISEELMSDTSEAAKYIKFKYYNDEWNRDTDI